MCVGACSVQRQRSTSFYIAWLWLELELTDTFFASTWCPNTLEWSLLFWKRFLSFLLSIYSYHAVELFISSAEPVLKWPQHTDAVASCGHFRCCLSRGGCQPVRLQSSRWSCLTWSTTQSTSPAEGALVRSVIQTQNHSRLSFTRAQLILIVAHSWGFEK